MAKHREIRLTGEPNPDPTTEPTDPTTEPTDPSRAIYTPEVDPDPDHPLTILRRIEDAILRNEETLRRIEAEVGSLSATVRRIARH